MKKLYSIGNYFFLELPTKPEPLIDAKGDVRIFLKDDSTGLYVIESVKIGSHEILLSEMQMHDGTPYDQTSWNSFYLVESGFVAVTKDYLLEVAKGNIPGTTQVIVAASNVSVGTSMETIWKSDGLWSPLTVARTMSIVSDSGADTLAGTGAQILILQGVDASGLEQTEIVELNGVTPVITSNTWLGINPSIITAGSGKKNVGTITITATVDLTLQSILAPGDSLTSALIYFVPVNKKLFLKQVRSQVYKSTGGGADVIVTGFFETNGTEYLFYEVDLVEDVSPTDMLRLETWSPIEGGSHVFLEAISTKTNTIVRAAFEGVLVDD